MNRISSFLLALVLLLAVIPIHSALATSDTEASDEQHLVCSICGKAEACTCKKNYNSLHIQTRYLDLLINCGKCTGLCPIHCTDIENMVALKHSIEELSTLPAVISTEMTERSPCRICDTEGTCKCVAMYNEMRSQITFVNRLLSSGECSGLCPLCCTTVSAKQREFYITSGVSIEKGLVTIGWVDTENNGPYKAYYYPCGYGMAPVVEESHVQGVVATQMVPGYRYGVFIDDSEYNCTEDFVVYIPEATTFFDGKLQATSITAEVKYRTRAKHEVGSEIRAIDALYAETIENDHCLKQQYGIYYKVNLPQLAYDRTYYTMLALREPGGFVDVEYSGWKTYHRYEYSSSERCWWFIGDDFFTRLLYEYGRIPTGEYYVDLYWDGMWVNTTPFYVY